MADRILGMGDIVTLVEKAQQQFDEKQARELQRKIAKNQFDFNDFIAQVKHIKDIDIDDNAFKGIEAIIQSMTAKERSNPDIINSSRRQRIARGSGTSIQEVNRLLKQFEQTRKMMKAASAFKANPAKMMRAMRGR